jgi:hypothetical protein
MNRKQQNGFTHRIYVAQCGGGLTFLTAKKAVHKQKAKLVVFEFETMTGNIRDELNKIKRMNIKVKYFTTADKIIIDL